MEWIKENLILIEVWIVIVTSLVGIVGAWIWIVKEMMGNDRYTRGNRRTDKDNG